MFVTNPSLVVLDFGLYFSIRRDCILPFLVYSEKDVETVVESTYDNNQKY